MKLSRFDSAISKFACDFELAVKKEKSLKELDVLIDKEDKQLLNDIDLLNELDFGIRRKTIVIVNADDRSMLQYEVEQLTKALEDATKEIEEMKELLKQVCSDRDYIANNYIKLKEENNSLWKLTIQLFAVIEKVKS